VLELDLTRDLTSRNLVPVDGFGGELVPSWGRPPRVLPSWTSWTRWEKKRTPDVHALLFATGLANAKVKASDEQISDALRSFSPRWQR